ncbi:MAG: lysophospholipid acyltransferase family protein [Spirochaetes bacterium]|nr:lysophospholipid acyltransferase family protein [Spirochaetota bacterium]
MLRTIVFFTYFWLSLVLSTPFCLVFLALRLAGLGPLTEGVLRVLASAWARSVLFMCGSTVSVEGREKVPAGGRVCFVANHQGDMDIILMLAYLPRVAGFIAKREALFIPILNVWIVVLGSVFIDRKSIRKARDSIGRGIGILGKGHAMIVFPEGTRSRGRTMLPFHNGSFKLATQSEATIVPVTIDGTWRIWEERKRITPNRTKMVFHDPVATAGIDAETRRLIPDRVRTAIASGLPAST